MPFTYLGLPIGTTRPTVMDCTPICTGIERNLLGITSMLRYYGTFLLVNSLITSLPMYYMTTIEIPGPIMEQVDKYRKYGLWSGRDITKTGKCRVAWKKAIRPKEDGGFSILDPKVQNKALLMKFLHKFYNRLNIPWVSFTWQAYYSNSKVSHHRRPVGSFW